MEKLRMIENAQLKGKTVLMRVDHNVVKKGSIKDPYRIDASLPTIDYILKQGGRIILMSHVGRPRDKASGCIDISSNTSVQPIVDYLNKKGYNASAVQPGHSDEYGIISINKAEVDAVFANTDSNIVYLPNTRWFAGEEAKNEKKAELGIALSSLADIFVNDAFGSWQPHASTIEPATHLPAYAGILMQKEVKHLGNVLNPKKPFVAVVAGSKFDTKIKPLSALLKNADHLILGGIIFNAYLCVNYDIDIAGVSEEDKLSAQEFVNLTSEYPGKLIEPQYIVESDTLEGKITGSYRIHNVADLKPGTKLNYVLDVAAESFNQSDLQKVFRQAGTFFVNAVMGLTPHFCEGTIALNKEIAKNSRALKLFGGGDTLQEFALLLPDLYQTALIDDNYYFFTGGGTILKAISEGSALGLEPVKALLE